jgi:uncharacterized protein YjiS (DUF1127 family)
MAYLRTVPTTGKSSAQGQAMSTTNSNGSAAGQNQGPWQYVLEWVQSTRSRHELMMLSDRELSDMGLERTYPPEVGLHFTLPTTH